MFPFTLEISLTRVGRGLLELMFIIVCSYLYICNVWIRTCIPLHSVSGPCSSLRKTGRPLRRLSQAHRNPEAGSTERSAAMAQLALAAMATGLEEEIPEPIADQNFNRRKVLDLQHELSRLQMLGHQ